MNILDIGGGFTGSEFQLKQVSVNGDYNTIWFKNKLFFYFYEPLF